jgi:Zn-dependent oligopeptidase
MSPQSSTDIALEYENNPEIVKINERIKKLESDFDNATTAADRQKFNAALNDTQESKLKLKKILREAEMLKRTSDKKTIVVTFGTPEVIKTDNIKKPFFKADDVQKTIPVDGDEK